MRKGLARRSRPEHAAPVTVAAALQDVMRQLGLTTKLNEYAAMTRWREIVGEQIARVAVPQRVENGILFVHVDSGPWRAELAARRLDLQRKVNEAIGANVVKEIRFR